MENGNRSTNMWIPPVVPTHDQWRRTYRTLDDMKKVTIILKDNCTSIRHCTAQQSEICHLAKNSQENHSF